MNRIAKIMALSFILNLVWEMSQAFLFMPHFSGAADFIRVHVLAAFTDVVITLLILGPELFLSDRTSSVIWRRKRVAMNVSLGFLAAVAIERYAVSTGMWAYGPFMPIIPILGVGLTPVLQMAIIPSAISSVFRRTD